MKALCSRIVSRVTDRSRVETPAAIGYSGSRTEHISAVQVTVRERHADRRQSVVRAIARRPRDDDRECGGIQHNIMGERVLGLSKG